MFAMTSSKVISFFVEVPPLHTSENIKSRFEDELDNFGFSCFMVMMDNASNMKHAFQTMVENYDEKMKMGHLRLSPLRWIPYNNVHHILLSLKVGLCVLPIKYSWLSKMGMTS